jgi:hypothetical protein
MTLFYAEPPTDNALLEVFRVIAASAMATCLVLGVVAVRRRDFVRHRAWMVRACAIALGAGTQVFTHLPWVLLVGTPGGYPPRRDDGRRLADQRRGRRVVPPPAVPPPA